MIKHAHLISSQHDFGLLLRAELFPCIPSPKTTFYSLAAALLSCTSKVSMLILQPVEGFTWAGPLL